MDKNLYKIENLSTPFIAVVLHDGHYISEELKPFLLLSEHERAREEDPYTWHMAEHLPVTKVRVYPSRFQTDLNRHKEKAVYLQPEVAWGLHVWNNLPEEYISALHNDYDNFYRNIYQLIDDTIRKHGFAFILDIHTYNHRRESPVDSASQETHPDINLGTFYNHDTWKKLFTAYNSFIKDYEIKGKKQDIRENIIFKGGGFAQQVIKKYNDKCGVLSIEFKKTFMDEWTGIADISHVSEIKNFLSVSLEYLQKETNHYK